MTRDGLVRDNWEQYKPGKKIKPSKQFIKRSRELKDFLIKVLPDLSEIEENPGEIRHNLSRQDNEPHFCFLDQV